MSALGDLKAAAQAYGMVVTMAPNHAGARVQLSLIQQQLGLDKEALETLVSSTEGEKPQSLFSCPDIVFTNTKSYSLSLSLVIMKLE